MNRLYLVVAACIAIAIGSTAASPAGNTVKNGLIVAEADTGNGAGFQLYSVDPEHPQKQPVQITHLASNPNNVFGMAPSFDRRGNRLAFLYEAPNGSGFDAYLIDLDGKHLKQLTRDQAAVSISWMPDGTHLLLGDAYTHTGRAELSMIDTDGNNRVPLTNDAFDNAGGWSMPDGTRIVFSSARDGITSAVWGMNPDGSDKQRLTDVARVFCAASISRDGSKVLLQPYCNQADSKPQNIWAMNADGRDVHQITNPPPKIVDLAGVYSPDGTKIAFSSNRGHPNGLFALWVMNADGTDAKELLKSPAAFPTWAAAK